MTQETDPRLRAQPVGEDAPEDGRGARRLDRRDRAPSDAATISPKRKKRTTRWTTYPLDPSDVETILDVEYCVLTRTGLQCAPLIHEHMGTTPRGTVRLSIGPFNTEEHIETAIRAVPEIAADRN